MSIENNTYNIIRHAIFIRENVKKAYKKVHQGLD